MTSLDQVIDHAAELQARLDQVYDELLILYLSLFVLSVLLAVVAWKARP